MLLTSTPSLSAEHIHFQQILNMHSTMKINHSLLEYTRDTDTQVSELGPSGSSCFMFHRVWNINSYVLFFVAKLYVWLLLTACVYTKATIYTLSFQTGMPSKHC